MNRRRFFWFGLGAALGALTIKNLIAKPKPLPRVLHQGLRFVPGTDIPIRYGPIRYGAGGTVQDGKLYLVGESVNDAVDYLYPDQLYGVPLWGQRQKVEAQLEPSIIAFYQSCLDNPQPN